MAPTKKSTAKAAKKPPAKSAAKKSVPKKGTKKSPVAKPAAKKDVAAKKSLVKTIAKPVTKALQKPVQKSPVKMSEPEKKQPARAAAKKLEAAILAPDYHPKKDKGEFMNDMMAEYFRQKLIKWREELLRESSETIHITLQGTELQKPDLADRAAAETDHALELRTRDRERKLISKISEAILRIDEGTYGYCEETGEPISVARLDARPIATLSLEAQERHERLEKTHRDE